MARGFRQRDPETGVVLVDISTRLPRLIGRVSIAAGVNGSVSVPVNGGNSIVYWFNASTLDPDFNATPAFTVDGNTIRWTYPSAIPNYNRGGVLVYGRY